MKSVNWERLKKIVPDKSDLAIKLLFLFITVYLVSTGMDHKKIKLPLVFLGLMIIVFFVKKLNQPLLWYIFLTILISDLICDYFGRANHHFLLIYLTAVLIVFLSNNNQDDFITNIKLLVFIVLIVSGIQKLLSPQFTSGNLYYYMINTGYFFKPILYFNQDINVIVISNKTQIFELGQTDPNIGETIHLKNVIPNLEAISRVFAWFTIIIEFVIAILVLWKPKHIVTHLLFITLIMGIFLTRLENGFLTLLAISGIFLSEHTRIRAIYTILALVFLSLIIAKIGFY